MTKNKDLKRLVRIRMQKTGESYAAARAQLVDAEPDLHEYADLAGMSDEAVRTKTGRTWIEWAKALDLLGAQNLPHPQIAKRLAQAHPSLSGWWVQTVTVGYERIRGLRGASQSRDGTWSANKSRTFSVEVETLYAAFTQPRLRDRWLPDASLYPGTPLRSAGLETTLGRVSLYFTDKSPKSSVAVQHRNLARKGDVDVCKAFWQARFDALSELLSG